MHPLKNTITASLQMLERLAGGQNPVYSIVYGCDDLSDTDSFLDYKDELFRADCSQLTSGYHDSCLHLHGEVSHNADRATRNLCKSELEILDIETERETSECSFDAFRTSRNRRLRRRACGCNVAPFVPRDKNSSTSQVSWCDHCGGELPVHEDARSESARRLAQPSHAQTSSHSREAPACSDCHCGVSRSGDNFHQTVSKRSNFPEEGDTKILRRKTNEIIGQNSLNLSSTSSNKLMVLSTQSDIQPVAVSSKEVFDGCASHDLLNPECCVCFRKHAEQDDDVSFSEYGVLPDCQHSFCQCCIASWLQQSAVDRWRCPVCRTSVLFTFVSRLWLPHNTEEKTRQLAGTRTRLLLARMVLRKATTILRLLFFYWTIGVKALRNLVEEITPEFEPLLHRHEIGAFI